MLHIAGGHYSVVQSTYIMHLLRSPNYTVMYHMHKFFNSLRMKTSRVPHDHAVLASS